MWGIWSPEEPNPEAEQGRLFADKVILFRLGKGLTPFQSARGIETCLKNV